MGIRKRRESEWTTTLAWMRPFCEHQNADSSSGSSKSKNNFGIRKTRTIKTSTKVVEKEANQRPRPARRQNSLAPLPLLTLYFAYLPDQSKLESLISQISRSKHDLQQFLSHGGSPTQEPAPRPETTCPPFEAYEHVGIKTRILAFSRLTVENPWL